VEEGDLTWTFEHERPRLAHAIDGALNQLCWPDGEINPSTGEEINERYVEEGVEALAWYSSAHVVPAAEAGIWVREQGLHLAAERLAGSDPVTRRHVQLAFAVILLHELFHAVVDRVLTTAGDWLSARDGKAARIYERYVREIQPRFAAAGEPLEEALANAFALRKFEVAAAAGTAADVAAVRQWMTGQPDGYKHFGAYEKPADFAAGTRVLGARAIGAARSSPGSPTHPLDQAFAVQIASLNPFTVPTFLICDLPDPRASLFPVLMAVDGQAQRLQTATEVLWNACLVVPAMDMAVTEDGRRELQHLVNEATAAAAVAEHLAPGVEREEINARLGRSVLAWPSRPVAPSPLPPPQAAGRVREAYAAARSQTADTAKRLKSDLAWGSWRDLEDRTWRADHVRELERAITTMRGELTAIDQADVPHFAVQLW